MGHIYFATRTVAFILRGLNKTKTSGSDEISSVNGIVVLDYLK